MFLTLGEYRQIRNLKLLMSVRLLFTGAFFAYFSHIKLHFESFVRSAMHGLLPGVLLSFTIPYFLIFIV